MPKISIIMPIYNVEKYLPKCFDSVIASTLEDIEIIAVDDGAKDNSGKIVDEYASKDCRIIPIHKENGGYGSAINAGLEIAKGEYIAILETDDWIMPNMYEELYLNALKYKSDVTKGNYYSCPAENKKKFEKFSSFLPVYKPFKLKDENRLLILAPSIWSAIYKREFLETNNIKCTEKVTPYEDLPFACEVYSKAESIVLIDKPLYCYRCEPKQGSSTIRNDRKLFKVIEQINNCLDIVKEIGSFDYIQEALFKHIYNSMLLFVGNAHDELKEELFNKFGDIFNSHYGNTLKYELFRKSEIKHVKYLKNHKYSKFKNSKIFQSIFYNIFSMTNKHTHKIIVILGIKFKFRRNKNNNIFIKDNEKLVPIKKYKGINFNISGENNTVILHKGLIAKDVTITVKNDNCKIEIEKSPWFDNVNINCVNGNGQQIFIGENTSFAPFDKCKITVDDSNEVRIGKDCMFSDNVDLWATDGHAILDNDSKICINKQKSPLTIGNHCWIGEYSKITKNALIPNDCIVGMSSVVTKKFETTNCIIAGNPAKIVKTNINWDKRSTYDY